MNEAKKRTLLYGLGACLAGALLFVGFVVKLPPDVEQLLTSASFEVKIGAIRGAREHLAQALELEPKNWKALWMDAYCAELEGKSAEAVGLYRRALDEITAPAHREEIQAAVTRLQEGMEASKKGKSP